MPKILILMLAIAVAGCGGSSPATSSGGGQPPPTYPFTGASTLQFVHEFGTNTYIAATEEGDTITSLTQDASGNLLLAGYTAGNLPGYSGSVGLLKGILYKLDANGNQLWAKD